MEDRPGKTGDDAGRSGDDRAGLRALFATRREAELAVEHLVQEYKIARAAIFLEPAGRAGSAGTRVGGGDEAAAPPGTRERTDAPLAGEIRLTVAVTDDDRALVDRALRDAGARWIGSA